MIGQWLAQHNLGMTFGLLLGLGIGTTFGLLFGLVLAGSAREAKKS